MHKEKWMEQSVKQIMCFGVRKTPKHLCVCLFEYSEKY